MIPKTARHQPNGNISFPMRGKPPVCDEPGYIEDPGDEYRWLMLYVPCTRRVEGQKYTCPKSRRVGARDFCMELNMAITPRYCRTDCSVPECIRCPSKFSNEEKSSACSTQQNDPQTQKEDVTAPEPKLQPKLEP